ncbi:hypothetical protein [Pyxidicoccus xibeiensis]|uniref:hypothetical protein n=1 Tax=Pyxidicoccus xibeiensis TaxID=2906759 RepID=UPI0020A7DEC5|nr:hypothetical protein [Pyxidicoccus xibeiensis]MCP3139368.1 hypothetical protein [Pyxidicoccus xibeiensis]
MTLRTLTLTAVLTLGSLLTGCSNHADSICDTRKECFDDDLDTGTCAERIDEWIEDEDEEDRQERVERCAECLDGSSCAQVLESCLDECFNIP